MRRTKDSSTVARRWHIGKWLAYLTTETTGATPYLDSIGLLIGLPPRLRSTRREITLSIINPSFFSI
jgi:hypothetical protein